MIASCSIGMKTHLINNISQDALLLLEIEMLKSEGHKQGASEWN